MKILTLNCQRAHHKIALIEFLLKVTKSEEYDAIFLQEIPQEIIGDVDPHNLYNHISDRSIRTTNGRVALLLKKEYEIMTTDHCLFERQKTEYKEYFFELISVVCRGQDSKTYILSSLHMPAYLHFIRRIGHLRKVLWRIKKLKKQNHKDSVVVTGGDWNSVFPLEHNLLSLTLDSRYKFIFGRQPTVSASKIEPGLFWNNFVKKVSSIIKLDYVVDFFFINRKMKAQISVIESDVSDHNPVALIIKD